MPRSNDGRFSVLPWLAHILLCPWRGALVAAELAPPSAPALAYIDTAQHFKAALEAGMRHLIIREHLDLTALPQWPSMFGDVAFPVQPTTESISGNCTTAGPPGSPPDLWLSPRHRCVLTVRSTLFAVLAHGSSFWLDFVTIHMPAPPPLGGETSLLVANGDVTHLWVTNSTFAGSGEHGAVRGAQLMSGVRSLFADTCFFWMRRTSGPAVSLSVREAGREAASAHFQQCLFRGNVVAEGPEPFPQGVVAVDSTDAALAAVLLEDCTFHGNRGDFDVSAPAAPDVVWATPPLRLSRGGARAGPLRGMKAGDAVPLLTLEDPEFRALVDARNRAVVAEPWPLPMTARRKDKSKAFIPGVVVCTVLVGALLCFGLALLVPWRTSKARKKKEHTAALRQSQHAAAEASSRLDLPGSIEVDRDLDGGPAAAQPGLSLEQSWHAVRSANFPTSQEANPFHTEPGPARVSSHRQHRSRPAHLREPSHRTSAEAPHQHRAPRKLCMPRDAHSWEASGEAHPLHVVSSSALYQQPSGASLGRAPVATAIEASFGLGSAAPTVQSTDARSASEGFLALPAPPNAPLAPRLGSRAPWSSGADQPAKAQLEGELDTMYRRRQRFAGRFDLLCRLDRRHGTHSLVQFIDRAQDGAECAVKFFLCRDEFSRELALYARPALRRLLVPIAQVCENRTGEVRSPRGFVFPPFAVMERCEALNDWACTAAPDMATALFVLLHVARKLVALHALGLCHRDIKPSNIMLRPRAQTWSLMDLANAAEIGERAPMAYSLRYAPPEVITADGAGEEHMEASPAVDVWALGVVAFELMAGRRAFCGTTPDATVREQLMGGAPLPWEAGPERRALLQSLRGLRVSVLRCLERDPVQRPSSDEVLDIWERLFERVAGTTAAQFTPAPPPEMHA